MTTSDSLLERINKRVNRDTDRFDITITVNGAVITGRLISRAVWLEVNIKLLNDIDKMLFADEFAAEGGSSDNGEYLHLSEAKTLSGLEIPVAVGMGYVRIPTASVDSWAVGRVDIQRAR
ncbi:hypothetical protein ACFVHS_30970 [Streptomyces sp. NPDC057746]|uniref:hypothetical protein n=1 Tax=Streptomyces sp. NPDC057746 TaxID=3346237 RepID=UPI0036AED622